MIARIAPLKPPYNEAQAEALKKMMPPNAPTEALLLFRVLGKNLELMSRMRPLGAGLLGHSLISPREREIIILRTCAQCGAEYEWGVHATAFGEMVGLSEEEIAATFSNALIWPEREAALIALVNELHETSKISNSTWASLEAFWDEKQLIELIVLVGWYHTISFLCNATQIPMESWAAPFPKV
jgi:4-carboxymuconolactone decarboxylase